MRIFIRASANGFPETETEYTAWQGFQELGFKPIFFKSENELEDCRPDDLIVGGVTVINRRLNAYGITIDEYDYPTQLSDYLGRRVWKDMLEGILGKPEQWPVFVKPVKNKAFLGFVLKTGREVPRMRSARPDEPVWCSELVSFQAEWRVFVRYGNVWDVRPYRGDWRAHFDASVIEDAVRKFTAAPAGYAMDFGATDDGRTLLIEVNDGIALGCYGADPVEYAKTLSARWCELVGMHDECDRYFEASDWKNRFRDDP